MPAEYDLEERLLEYSARIIRLVERLPNSRAGNHLAGQLLRSGTSPLPNHGEAQAVVYGVPALVGQTQFHHGSPSVSSRLQGTARRRLKPGLHTLPPARVCYSALCSLVPLWNARASGGAGKGDRRADPYVGSTFDVQRWTFEVRSLLTGARIRTIQELLGHNDVSTTMIYTHVLRQGGSGMKSLLDCL